MLQSGENQVLGYIGLVWGETDLRTVIMHRARPVYNPLPQVQSLPSFSFSGQKVTSSLDWGKTSGLIGYWIHDL